MIIYGSQTSPFVRRLRLLLPEGAYEFRKVNIFDREERKKLLVLSPLLKIPILQINEDVVWDSRIIFNELSRRGFHPALSLREENLLTAINDLSDSLVQSLLARRSNITIAPDSPLGVSHQERILNTLNFLEAECEKKSFENWNFLGMCLYCLIDWIEFRELHPLKNFPQLLAFRDRHSNQRSVKESDPRIDSN